VNPIARVTAVLSRLFAQMFINRVNIQYVTSCAFRTCIENRFTWIIKSIDGYMV